MFVVDSADKERLDEAQDLLEELLCHEELTGTPVVVVANKQDIEGIFIHIWVSRSTNYLPCR